MNQTDSRSDLPIDPDDKLDAALRAYARHCDQAVPPPSLPEQIAERIAAVRGGVVSSSDLRQFVEVVAADPVVQSRLSGSASRAEFVGLFTLEGAARGFRFLQSEVYAFFRRFEIAADGELNDDQLDAVAAAGEADGQLLWQLFRDKK